MPKINFVGSAKTQVLIHNLKHNLRTTIINSHLWVYGIKGHDVCVSVFVMEDGCYDIAVYLGYTPERIAEWLCKDRDTREFIDCRFVSAEETTWRRVAGELIRDYSLELMG